MTCVAHTLAVNRGLLHTEDVDVIRSAVAGLPVDRPVFVVDLGAGSGTTALAVFAERHHDLQVMTVDNDQTNLDSAAAAVTGSGFGYDLWQPVNALSWDGAEVFTAQYPGAQVDLLLVDAGHSLQEVERDLAAWLPLVRPGAPVWMHDFVPTDGGWWPGVAAAIEAAVAAGRLEFAATAGWCWLGRKPLI